MVRPHPKALRPHATPPLCGQPRQLPLAEAYQITTPLAHQSVGTIKGSGFVDPTKIAWEFNRPEIGFAGFELYEKDEENRYRLHAEYASSDQFRTVISGKVWRKKQIDK